MEGGQAQIKTYSISCQASLVPRYLGITGIKLPRNMKENKKKPRSHYSV